MPLEHVETGSVLSRIAEFPGIAGKLAPVEKVRDL
jgi:hypothetical protein